MTAKVRRRLYGGVATAIDLRMINPALGANEATGSRWQELSLKMSFNKSIGIYTDKQQGGTYGGK